MKVHHYIIDTSKPFAGTTQNATYLDDQGREIACYTGQTVEEYMKERGDHFRLITEAELSELLDAHYKSLITEPTPISEDQYNEWLECLPPCRYTHIAGFSVFHISERLTGRLVQWCARNGSMSCYGFTDRDNLTLDELKAKLLTIKRA